MSVNGAHALADLQPTEAELADLADVLAEVEAEELPDGDYGPWDDSAGLSSTYDLAAVGELAGQAGEREATRLQEDLQDALARRPSYDVKLGRAFDRIARGTYLPTGMYAQGRDAGGQFAPYGCGQVDDFGRCSARFHQATCFETVRGSAATSDATAVEAWNATLTRAAPVTQALLANPGPQDPPGPADTATLAAMRQILGVT